jgi:hypothetical protein
MPVGFNLPGLVEKPSTIGKKVNIMQHLLQKM